MEFGVLKQGENQYLFEMQFSILLVFLGVQSFCEFTA